jgi:hypothetical protein
MATDMRQHLFLIGLLATTVLPAQDLRRGLLDADLVVVGRQVGRTAHNEHLELHRLQILRDIRGAEGRSAVTILDWPKLALHQRPTLRQTRLYCLQDASAAAERLGLPVAQGPYYKMIGWAGANPLLGADLDQDATVQFAELLARSDAGASPATTAEELFRVATTGTATLRLEATRMLSERGDLRQRLLPPHWSQLVSLATGEADDLAYKTALAELCAEQRLEGLLELLAVGLGQVHDVEYARTVGRIGKVLEGEAATRILHQRLLLQRDPKQRATLLLAIGATNTDSALQLLLQLDGMPGGDPAVVAALREHRAPQAREASARRR